MKTLFKLLLMASLLSNFLFAGQDSISAEKISENYLVGLKHENIGVVESAIRTAILLKIKYPNIDYDDIIDELEELTYEGANQVIRLKAFIAKDYFNNFAQHNWLKKGKYEDGDQLFEVYLDKMKLNKIAKAF